MAPAPPSRKSPHGNRPDRRSQPRTWFQSWNSEIPPPTVSPRRGQQHVIKVPVPSSSGRSRPASFRSLPDGSVPSGVPCLPEFNFI
jgi:hypothetical protein